MALWQGQLALAQHALLMLDGKHRSDSTLAWCRCAPSQPPKNAPRAQPRAKMAMSDEAVKLENPSSCSLQDHLSDVAAFVRQQLL